MKFSLLWNKPSLFLLLISENLNKKAEGRNPQLRIQDNPPHTISIIYYIWLDRLTYLDYKRFLAKFAQVNKALVQSKNLA